MNVNTPDILARICAETRAETERRKAKAPLEMLKAEIALVKAREVNPLALKQKTLALAKQKYEEAKARDRLADKRGGGAIHVTLQEDQASVAQEADEVLMLDAALARLAGEDAALAQVVECRLFGGLTETETADALGVPLRTVQRRWQLAREKLREHLQPG